MAVLANDLENGRYAHQNSDGFNEPAAFTELVCPLLLLSLIRLKTAVRLRTRIKRLQRKTICYSRSEELHDIVIGLFINRYEFGKEI